MRTVLRVTATMTVAVVACTDTVPSQLLVDANPVVLNGPASYRLPVTVLNRRGDTLSNRHLTYTVSPDTTLALTGDGTIRCLRRGDAIVTVRQNALVGALVIHCRPISAFGGAIGLRLFLGQAPMAPTVSAFDQDGQPVTELRATAGALDSRVARYANGVITPLGVGKTVLRLDFGGLVLHLTIEVVRSIEDARVSLAAGEIRTWRLPPGRVEVMLREDEVHGTAHRLVLEFYRANCARVRAGPGDQHVYCVSSGSGSLVVRNPVSVGSDSALSAELRLLEIP